ncbi:MAG: hypothetical protein ACLSDQ_09195 [Adlercreutzia equolifaciens]
MSDLSYTDPDAASTSLLIWELAALLAPIASALSPPAATPAS